MSPLVLLVLGPVVLFAAYGVARHLDARVRKHGPHALTWRWLTAEAWHGRPITNRGWTRPGTKALTPTGHAHRRYYWPRWRHTLWRLQWTLASLSRGPRPCPPHRYRCRLPRRHGHRRSRRWRAARVDMVRGRHAPPGLRQAVHIRVAPLAGIPVASKPESWLDIPRDRSYARPTWPKTAALPPPKDRDAIASALSATVGMRDAKISWQFTGPRPRLTLTPPVPAPRRVYLDRIEWEPRTPPHLRLDQDTILKAIREARC